MRVVAQTAQTALSDMPVMVRVMVPAKR